MISTLSKRIRRVFTGQRQPVRQPSYDELFKDELDGTAKYDDVWGAPCSTVTRVGQ